MRTIFRHFLYVKKEPVGTLRGKGGYGILKPIQMKMGMSARGLAESGFASLPDSCFFESLRDGGYGETMGLPPPCPAWGFHPQTPSSLRGGFKRLNRNQVSLRSLILVFLNRFAMGRYGGDDGVATPCPA